VLLSLLDVRRVHIRNLGADLIQIPTECTHGVIDLSEAAVRRVLTRAQLVRNPLVLDLLNSEVYPIRQS
jgi:hypothetical protein